MKHFLIRTVTFILLCCFIIGHFLGCNPGNEQEYTLTIHFNQDLEDQVFQYKNNVSKSKIISFLDPVISGKYYIGGIYKNSDFSEGSSYYIEKKDMELWVDLIPYRKTVSWLSNTNCEEIVQYFKENGTFVSFSTKPTLEDGIILAHYMNYMGTSMGDSLYIIRRLSNSTYSESITRMAYYPISFLYFPEKQLFAVSVKSSYNQKIGYMTYNDAYEGTIFFGYKSNGGIFMGNYGYTSVNGQTYQVASFDVDIGYTIEKYLNCTDGLPAFKDITYRYSISNTTDVERAKQTFDDTAANQTFNCCRIAFLELGNFLRNINPTYRQYD